MIDAHSNRPIRETRQTVALHRYEIDLRTSLTVLFDQNCPTYTISTLKFAPIHVFLEVSKL